MTVTVETLEKLERRITLVLPADTINNEVQTRLKKLARTVKADGFRPGKVPMSVVAQRYGYSVQYEVMNDKVGEVFAQAANEAKLRVAGQPRITEKEGAPEGELAFDAVFEVFPEVKIADLATAEVERVTAEVDAAAIDRTIEILRKQRRTFAQRAQAEAAQDGDRVTVDFEGKIDGEPFEGGKAEAFQFLIGEGQMLEQANPMVTVAMWKADNPYAYAEVRGRCVAEVAGKEADFLVTVRRIEAQHLPEVDDAFARSLGIKEATVDGLRADVRRNLEREVGFRVLSGNKAAVMDALVGAATLDLPESLIEAETERLVEKTRADLKQRGMKDADKAEIPPELVRPQAERRVRLGLVVAELVRAHDLRAKPEQIKAHVEEMAASYEKPADVVRWYYSDNQRLAEVEAVVIESNVAEFVLSKAKVTEKAISFEELIGQG